MKNYLIILLVAGSLVGCEHKETTVNPPAENNTTIVNPSPATAEKTETNTTINTAPNTETKTETKTSSSPNP